MRKRMLCLAGAFAIAALGGAGVASGHACTYDEETGEEIECHDTPVMPNWRDGNYIPLFDITDREDDSYDGQRWRAQRWREECGTYDAQGTYRGSQQCAWVYGGQSGFTRYGENAPNELHAGFAASHCFLFEFAHDCSDHQASRGEGVHDAHGGATYVDVCFTSNSESKYCKNGPSDTQAGLTIMDHNPCGTIVPIVACTDEYHLIRPLDPDYTMAQQEQSIAYIQRITAEPETYLCGKPEYGGCFFGSAPPSAPGDEEASGAASGPASDLVRAAQLARGPVTSRVTRPGGSARAGVPETSAPTAGRVAARGAPAERDDVAVWLAAAVLAALGLRARRVLDVRT